MVTQCMEDMDMDILVMDTMDNFSQATQLKHSAQQNPLIQKSKSKSQSVSSKSFAIIIFLPNSVNIYPGIKHASLFLII
jgi:hypothetical protein